MATNMYIKMDGIDGGATAAGHEKEIEILSWSHGFSQPTSPVRSSAGSGTVEQANHSNLTFTKYTDSSTDDLLKHCWNGKQVKECTLTCYRADGAEDNKPVEYLKVKIEQVVIANVSISAGAADIPIENISLDYGIIEYTYTGQKRADGTGSGVEPVKHDLTTRKIS